MKEEFSENKNLNNSSKQAGQKQCLNMNGCQCSICLLNINKKQTDCSPIEKQNNCLDQFLKQFPTNFPLFINPTTVYKYENGLPIHYSNGNKIQNKQYIFKTKVTKVLINFPISQNIHIFGNNFSKILPKHETTSYIKRLQQYAQINFGKKKGQKLLSNDENPELLPTLYRNSQKQKRSVTNKSNNNSSSFSHSFNIDKTSKILYLQSYYSQQIPIKLYYKRQQIGKKLDSIILEYLNEQQGNFQLEKPYEINQEFWQWIYNQYDEQTFAYFITEFYCRVYEYKSKNKINEGTFYWILERPKSQFGDNTKITQELGRHKMALEAQYFVAKMKKLNFKIKLLNVKNFNIEYFQNIKSFQEQYQQLILQRIKTEPSKQFRSVITDSNKKKYVYQNRLNSFQEKVRDLFLVEQNHVLKKVEKQKQFDGKQDSNKLAKLLLPNMGQYKSIRQILNDQCSFQKLILYGEKMKQKQRLRKARQSILGQNRGKMSVRVSSKYGYEQSRIKRKQFISRKMRIRTEYL